MKRVHVFEFEDLPWFPSWLRVCMTHLIVVFARMIGVTSVLTALVARILKAQQLDRVVDLGSGSGGVMPDVVEQLRQAPEWQHVSLLMTDLYPNPDAIARFEGASPHIQYHREPVDATDFAQAPEGLKTMVNSFHHMPPEAARSILASAHDNRQPLLIYEMAHKTVPFPVWCLQLPIGLSLVALMSLVLTPFVRPLTFRQLLWTYIIPIIPLCYAWDGQASMARMYTPEDLDQLLEGLDSPDYRWEKGVARKASGAPLGYYLLGCAINHTPPQVARTTR